MARSTYPIPTRETTLYLDHEGNGYDSEAKARQSNAKLALAKIVEENCYSGMGRSDVLDFIITHASAIGPWFDDLNG